MSEREIWLPVAETEGLYEVSNTGRVRSLDRFIEYKQRGKTVRRLQKGKLLSNSSDAEYQVVKVCYKDRHEYVRIHKLVAIAFVEKVEGKNYVNHIDANKHNNRADNLEWVTQKENIIHARKMGLCSDTIGEQHHNSKLTEDDIRWIRENDKATNGGKMLRKEIAKTLGISVTTVTHIANRKTWKHIE